MEQATSPETQAFLSDVADEMDAVAATLEASNGAATHRRVRTENPYLNAQFGSKVLYTACYTLSYGVCFPIFAACRYIPKNNQLVEGLVDGGVAANRAVNDLLNRQLEQATEQAEVLSAGVDALASA